MPMPRLLDPVPVKIRKADKKFTAKWDENAGEPYGQVRRKQKPISLMAQIGKGDTDDPRASEGGVTERSTGYLVFLATELRAKRVEIEAGDMVVEIGAGHGRREVQYFITKLQWRGHKRGYQGATLLKAHFMDRQPVKQEVD